MSTEYAGLCIGGPLAGEQAVSGCQRLEVAERPDLPILGGPEPIPSGTMTTKRHRYTWLHTGGFGLWIIEGMTLLDAVKAMALAYAAMHAGEKG